jgi:hypothetical protein
LAEALKKFSPVTPQVTTGQNVAALKIGGIDEPILR